MSMIKSSNIVIICLIVSIVLRRSTGQTQPCHETIQEKTSGNISSPGYPKSYAGKLFCSWLIKVIAESQVKLTFTEVDLEFDEHDEYDFVRVFDGGSCMAKQIAKFTKKPQNPFISTTNELLVMMQTDQGVNNLKGFLASFETVNGETPTSSNVSSNCGGILNEPKGNVSSPNYPLAYPVDQFCVWQFTSHNNKKINMTFTELNLEGQDSVKIFTGHSCVKEERVFTGVETGFMLTTTTDEALMLFFSDYSGNRKGFFMQYVQDTAETIPGEITTTLMKTTSEAQLITKTNNQSTIVETTTPETTQSSTTLSNGVTTTTLIETTSEAQPIITTSKLSTTMETTTPGTTQSSTTNSSGSVSTMIFEMTLVMSIIILFMLH